VAHSSLLFGLSGGCCGPTPPLCVIGERRGFPVRSTDRAGCAAFFEEKPHGAHAAADLDRKSGKGSAVLFAGIKPSTGIPRRTRVRLDR
jgi:hypothetical protein